MKRNFFKTIAAILTVATIIFAVSCEKNDDDNKNENPQPQPVTNTLVGTNWNNHDEGEDELDGGIMAHYVEDSWLRFETATTGNMEFSIEYEEYPEENWNRNMAFSYTYQAPNGTINASILGFSMNATFVVNGNQMTVTMTYDGDTETAIFTKQS